MKPLNKTKTIQQLEITDEYLAATLTYLDLEPQPKPVLSGWWLILGLSILGFWLGSVGAFLSFLWGMK